MRKALRITALTILLTSTVYAGDMPNGSTPPPPPPAPILFCAPADSEQLTNDFSKEPSNDIMTSALNVLFSVLSLF